MLHLRSLSLHLLGGGGRGYLLVGFTGEIVLVGPFFTGVNSRLLVG